MVEKNQTHIVIARRYRPQAFEEVIGQDHITRTLRNALTQNRTAHAYLFTGPRGVGKTTTARILAKAWNCEKGITGDPCGECLHCRAITHGNDLDVFEIDGASNRGIDEIRELKENIRYAPAQARFKVFIIDEVHMLTKEAFNALLKTLEEPPAHVKFIMATTEPHKIPLTILSRCQRFDFHFVSNAGIVEMLGEIVQKEGAEADPEALAMIARFSEGSVRDAESLLEQVLAAGVRRIDEETIFMVSGRIETGAVLRMLEHFITGEIPQGIELMGALIENGNQVSEIASEVFSLLRDMVLLRAGTKPAGIIDRPVEATDQLKTTAEKTSLTHLQQSFNLLAELEYRLKRSAFQRFLLEMALVNIAGMKELAGIGEMIAKLENVALGGGQAAFQTRSSAPGQAGIISPPPMRIPKKERPKQTRPSAPPSRERPSPEKKPSERGQAVTRPVTEKRRTAKPVEKKPHKIESVNTELVNVAVLAKIEDAIERMSDKQPILSSYFLHGAPLLVSDSKLIFGFREDSRFCMESLLEPTKKAIWTPCLEKALDAKIDIEMRPLKRNENAPTIQEIQDRRRKEDLELQEEKIMRNPLFQELKSAFPKASVSKVRQKTDARPDSE